MGCSKWMTRVQEFGKLDLSEGERWKTLKIALFTIR